MKKIILLYFFSQASFAMCEYPHNPPVVCLSGEVVAKKAIKHKKYRCLLSVNVLEMIRPSSTYLFDSNLDKVTFKKAQKLNVKKVDLYSIKNCGMAKIKTIAEYNCSDRHSDIPDMSLLDSGSIQSKVRDPWTEKSPLIDCSKLLSK